MVDKVKETEDDMDDSIMVDKVKETEDDMDESIMVDLSTEVDILFPNSIPLNYKYYQDERYTRLRRCKLMLFGDCLGDKEKFHRKYIGCALNKRKRTSIEDMLYEIQFIKESVLEISEYLNTPYSTKAKIIEKLERGCLNRSIAKAKSYNIRCVWSDERFVNLYNSICYKVASNIDPESEVHSTYIKNKILKNELDLEMVADMTSKELCPKKYEKIDKQMDQRINMKRKIKYSELFHCRKCKKNQCTTERRYNRSLDEGTNLTVKCMFCGHEWNA
jgi:DNA-directed RNA polymerase subunit M/transcription elongation factor TFIIS